MSTIVAIDVSETVIDVIVPPPAALVIDVAPVASGGIGEAPIDGLQYARADAAWEVVVGGGGGSTAWADITGKPSTFPPTLPIAQSGVTNLVTDLAGKAATVHTHAQADITNLTTDITAAKARANHTGTQLAATISDFSTAADARVALKITNKITVASTAPGSPAVNDVWIDTT